MGKEDNKKEILKILKELEKKALEIYPDIDKNIETYNSLRVEQESYLNYISLINETPLATASNQTRID